MSESVLSCKINLFGCYDNICGHSCKVRVNYTNEDWISPQISGGTPWNGFIMNSDCRQTKRSIMMKNLSRLLLPS